MKKLLRQALLRLSQARDFEGQGERGFLRLIIIIVIALLVISYFGINLRDLVNNPTTKDNFSYAATTTITFWDKYLKVPATYVWNDIFLDLIWNPSINNIKAARNGQTLSPTSTQPIVPIRIHSY